MIEKYFTGELESSDSDELESHIQSCSECREYYESLKERKRQFHCIHPFGSFIDAVKQRSTHFYIRLFDTIMQPALRPVYAMVLVIFIAVPFYISYKSRDRVRMKGGEDISFIYRRNGTVHKSYETEFFYENDEIQVVYTSPDTQYISLLSIDSRGNLSFYHPDIKSRWSSIKTGIGAGLYYPGSIVLDDTPGKELIIAVFTPKPVLTETVKSKADKLLNNKSAGLIHVKKQIDSGQFIKEGKTLTLMLNKR